MVSILITATENELMKCCGETSINKYKEALNEKLYLDMDYDDGEEIRQELDNQTGVVNRIGQEIIEKAKSYLLSHKSFDKTLIDSLEFELDCRISAFRNMMVRDVQLKGVRDYHYGSK